MKPANLRADTSIPTVSRLNNSRDKILLRAALCLLGFILLSVQINAQAVGQQPDLTLSAWVYFIKRTNQCTGRWPTTGLKISENS